MTLEVHDQWSTITLLVGHMCMRIDGDVCWVTTYASKTCYLLNILLVLYSNHVVLVPHQSTEWFQQP